MNIIKKYNLDQFDNVVTNKNMTEINTTANPFSELLGLVP
mgnify:CR=1 FL=1